MSNVLFNVSDEREKLPTLRQWLKERGKRKIAQVYPVMLIWLPTKYPNIVFETDSFRAILYSGNPAYKPVCDAIDGLVSAGTGLGISVDRDNPGVFAIVSLDNESPSIESISDVGWRYVY